MTLARKVGSAPRFVVFCIAIGLEGLLFIASEVLGWLLGTPPLAHARGTWSALGWGVLAGVPPALAVIVALRARVGVLLRDLRRAQGEIELLLDLHVWQLVFVAWFAGQAEEAMFRGVVQTAVAAGLAAWVDAPLAAFYGVVAGALLFGLAHPVSRSYVIAAAVYGIWMGILFLLTGNLMASIIAHALHDLIVLLYLKYNRPFSRVDASSSVSPNPGEPER